MFKMVKMMKIILILTHLHLINLRMRVVRKNSHTIMEVKPAKDMEVTLMVIVVLVTMERTMEEVNMKTMMMTTMIMST